MGHWPLFSIYAPESTHLLKKDSFKKNIEDSMTRNLTSLTRVRYRPVLLLKNEIASFLQWWKILKESSLKLKFFTKMVTYFQKEMNDH